MQGIAFVSHERLTGELGRLAHLAADEELAGMDDVPVEDTPAIGATTEAADGVTIRLLGSNWYGALCGAKNKGPFCPQADKPVKPSKIGATAMIRGMRNINGL